MSRNGVPSTLAYLADQVVNTFSSAIEHGLEIRGLIPADHRHMTRFSGLSDPGFKRVSAVLIRWAREIVETRVESQASYEEG